MDDATQGLLEALLEQAGLLASQLEYVGGFENEVFRFESPEGPRIVRVTEPEHRSREQIEAELNWIEFLYGRGIPVARPHRWPSGQLVESLALAEGAPAWIVQFDNFFVDARGQITVFDFDDACHHWYIQDLAMALYYACWPDLESLSPSQVRFFDGLVTGYRRVAELPEEWLARIPLFAALRDVLIIAVFNKRLDIANLGAMKPVYEARRERVLARHCVEERGDHR